MSELGIFLYGLVVTALVAGALGLIAWGIVKEKRDRQLPSQRREVFGERAADHISRHGDGEVPPETLAIERSPH
jgi:hypothetical protein